MEVSARFGRFVWREINIYVATIHPSRGSRINPTLKCERNQAAHASTVRYLSEHKHLYYICGDFNINLGNLEVESNIKDYVNSLISLSCKLLISKPTRVSDHSATIIDHMYTNDNNAWYII